jgi:hypothetical protein
MGKNKKASGKNPGSLAKWSWWRESNPRPAHYEYKTAGKMVTLL